MAHSDTWKSARLTRRTALGRLGAAAGTAVLAACAPASTTGPQAAVSTTDTSRFVVAVAEIGSQQWANRLAQGGSEEGIIQEIGQTLTRMNAKTGMLEGGIAESWSADKTSGTWTFKLRPNVPFHDGYGTLTAEDVKFTWEQFTQKDATHGQASYLRQAVDNDMKNFEIIGPLEFRVRTTKPVIVLPLVLDNFAAGPVIQSKKYWETKPAEALLHPIGTGPYKFVSSTKGVEVQLEAVPNHWRQTSTFKAVTWKLIADDAARVAAVASGSVDLAQVEPKLLREAKAQGLASTSIPDTNNWTGIFGGWYIGDPVNYTPNAPWIQADRPEKGLAIRQAMSLAIDRKTIIERLFSGEGKLVHAPFFEFPSNPLSTDPSWPLPAYDVAKAKQLLAEGGYPNGFEVTVPMYERGEGELAMNEAVASSFEAIGLKVKRLVADYAGVIAPQIRTRKTAGWFYPVAFRMRDPVIQLSNLMLPTSGTVRMIEPFSTAAYRRMESEYDVAKRYEIMRELEAAMIKNVLAIPLFLGSSPYLVSKKFGTWAPVPGLRVITNLESITAK